jgi:hypothetical protein
LRSAYNENFIVAKKKKSSKWLEAEASFELLVSLQIRMLGEEHPDTLLSIAKYAWTLSS